MRLTNLCIIGAMTNKLLAGPQTIYVDLTNKCNLKCTYCWIQSPLIPKKRHPQTTNMDIKTIRDITDTAANWKNVTMLLTGDGEPTMHPQVKEIIDYIHKKRIRILMTTNATFSKKSLLHMAKIDRLYINLSAPNKKLYNMIQISANDRMYGKVIENIKFLTAFHKKFKKPELIITFVITKTNYKAIPAMLALIKKLQLSRIHFQMMNTNYCIRKVQLPPRELTDLARIINQPSIAANSVNHNLQEIRESILSPYHGPYTINQCLTGWFALYIDLKKNAHLCCQNSRLIIGNLRHDSLEELWNSKKAHQLRLKCKYDFQITKLPFKEQCEWCHWHKKNNKILEEIKRLKNAA